VNETGVDIYDALQLWGSELVPDVMHEVRNSTVDRGAMKK
jgi:hypothetical protein